MKEDYRVVCGDCLEWLQEQRDLRIHLTFLDPPFNQGKDYRFFDDSQPESKYWDWIGQILRLIFKFTDNGGAVYFMQREKNVEFVTRSLRETGWTLQNVIVWKKKTSAVPTSNRFGKHYQVIAFATKGDKPRVFNKLRISPPLPANYKYERTEGVYVTDVWDDIRELTSGYFAGDEALRNERGERVHKQQSPIALLLRLILSSTKAGDTVFDPFAGTGTTLSVANQLRRKAVGIEIDSNNEALIHRRLSRLRKADDVTKYYQGYLFTANLDEVWGSGHAESASQTRSKQMKLGETRN